VYAALFNADVQKQEAAMQTPPATPNPFTWRRFANVRMGDYLLGEDTVSLVDLGFCSDTVTVSCSVCGEVLGHVPVELLGEEFRDLTTTHITHSHARLARRETPLALCLATDRGKPKEEMPHDHYSHGDRHEQQEGNHQTGNHRRQYQAAH
jgi:hypothetical protein